MAVGVLTTLFDFHRLNLKARHGKFFKRRVGHVGYGDAEAETVMGFKWVVCGHNLSFPRSPAPLVFTAQILLPEFPDTLRDLPHQFFITGWSAAAAILSGRLLSLRWHQIYPVLCACLRLFMRLTCCTQRARSRCV